MIPGLSVDVYRRGRELHIDRYCGCGVVRLARRCGPDGGCDVEVIIEGSFGPSWLEKVSGFADEGVSAERWARYKALMARSSEEDFVRWAESEVFKYEAGFFKHC